MMQTSQQNRRWSALRASTVVVLAACSQFLLGGTSSADRNAKRAPAAAGAHDTFAVQDVKIGMPIEGRPGFTCDKEIVGKDRHCVKFLDKRCSGRPASVGVKRYSDAAPLGCFMDYSANATYLDGKLLQTANSGDSTDKRPMLSPLINIQLTGTRSSPSKIYQIHYMFAVDELTEDSKLYGALVAKYGEPSSKNPPIEMRWKSEDTKLKAVCQHDHCEIIVEDNAFEDLERRKQEEADSQTRHKNAPAAPDL